MENAVPRSPRMGCQVNSAGKFLLFRRRITSLKPAEITKRVEFLYSIKILNAFIGIGQISKTFR